MANETTTTTLNHTLIIRAFFASEYMGPGCMSDRPAPTFVLRTRRGPYLSVFVRGSKVFACRGRISGAGVSQAVYCGPVMAFTR